MMNAEVRLLGEKVRELLCSLPPGAGMLAGTPAEHFLRGDLEDGDEELVYRDGVVVRLKDCSLEFEEEIVKHLRPTDFARSEGGEAAFVWLADGEERVFEYGRFRWRLPPHIP
jgi:hypothetical protein